MPFEISIIVKYLKVKKTRYFLVCDVQELGHVCSVCDQVITGEVYVIDEAYYCQKDFEVP